MSRCEVDAHPRELLCWLHYRMAVVRARVAVEPADRQGLRRHSGRRAEQHEAREAAPRCRPGARAARPARRRSARREPRRCRDTASSGARTPVIRNMRAPTQTTRQPGDRSMRPMSSIACRNGPRAVAAGTPAVYRPTQSLRRTFLTDAETKVPCLSLPIQQQPRYRGATI